MHRREGRLIVSATDLVGFLECGHLTTLERAAAAGLIDKPIRDDPEVELLQRRGGEHEQRYIAELERRGRTITRLTADWDRPYEERAAETEQYMRRGDDVIYQATVFDGRWVGHPDFLLRVDRPSALGDWHYEVADTKLAHSAKAAALVQICSYVEQVERIQGVRPENVYVVTGGAEIAEHRFRTAEMMAYYRHAKAQFESVLEEELDLKVTYPDPVEHCAVCRWSWAECQPMWRRDDALPLVAAITRSQRKELLALSVATRGGLAVAQELDEKFERVRAQARLQVASDGLAVPEYELLEPERDSEGSVVVDRGLSALPEPSVGDLFFDIEGDPFAFWEGLEYLFGLWLPGTGDGLWDRGEYRELWAMDRAHEKQAFEQVIDLFIGRLAEYPDMHVYHYGAYEPSRLKRLAGLHATREEELDRLLRGRVFVDLYRAVRQGLRVGTERYSIKNLEPLYGFRREVELRDANSSIVEFEKMLEIGDPGDVLKDKIAAYNRDDCVSTLWLRDWLEARRSEAARQLGGELPRPPATGQEPPSEDLSERIRAVRELTERLTRGIKPDPADQSQADLAIWLVAHLLDWHRRENKSAWWRFYDLLTQADDELFDDAEALGRLEFVEKFELGGRFRSDDYRYRFPPQEHKVDEGVEAHDPQLTGGETRTGTVVAIDKDAGTIDIRRPKTWIGQHPTSIVPLNIYRVEAQQGALMRFGAWVADNGIDSDLPEWRAARDLLRRRPPRLVAGLGESGGALVGGTETGTEAARRLALLLDGTTLAIQGPPGSGKTYTGARMILDLVRAGRVVGISSNSHKVICNLLTEVLRAARAAGGTLRAVQKGDEHEVVDDPMAKRARSNDEVDQALAEGAVDVIAGTPWLWARPDIAGAIDTLFVDEAGQVSLANVVAMSGAARNVVLLGDPQQLDQPTQGVHPDGAGGSALGHFLGEAETVPPDRGLFLERTYRMHPSITAYTSELFYEGKLTSVEGLEAQRIRDAGPAGDWLSGSGPRWVPVEHEGNTNESVEEADVVSDIWNSLIGRQWVDAHGDPHPIGADDIVIVSPFNAHRLRIQERLPHARVGTVDKFQGQQAPVSIYTMATSLPGEAPRGMGFLYSLNRLNVATSRARALAIVVASPALLAAVPRTPEQLRMANGLCAFVEAAAS